MKYILKYKLSIFILVTLVSLFTSATAVGSVAFANNLNYFATQTPGTSCSLYGPTGGPQGVIISDGNTCCPGTAQDAATISSSTCLFSKYINPLISLFSALVGVVVVIAVIIGGIEYSSSAGDPQRAAAARTHITNALLGLFAYIFLYAFLQFLIPGGFLHG
jgi:hypothetical protein